jgi:hypothetical protein
MRIRRAEGDRYVEPAQTLGDEIAGWLARWRATRTRSPRTVEFYERSAKFWARLDSVHVSDVRRAVVEDLIAVRALGHPKSAANELELLKRVLRNARARGQRIDEAVLSISPVRHLARKGRALTVEQLYDLASWFPEYAKRLVLLAGMIGARQRVWFEMTDDLLDLRAGALDIPPWLAKNGKAHPRVPDAARSEPIPRAASRPGSRFVTRLPHTNREGLDSERLSRAGVGEGSRGGGCE